MPGQGLSEDLGALVPTNLEADFRVVVEWPRVALVRSTPGSLSHLLTANTTDPFADAVLLKHWNSVLIGDLPGLNPSLI